MFIISLLRCSWREKYLGGQCTQKLRCRSWKWRVQKAAESRHLCGGIWGEVFPPQLTRGSGGALWLPSWLWGFAPARNAFLRMLKAAERSLFAYVPMLWVRQCFISHLWGKAKVWGSVVPLPQRRIAPEPASMYPSLSTITHLSVSRRKTQLQNCHHWQYCSYRVIIYAVHRIFISSDL